MSALTKPVHEMTETELHEAIEYMASAVPRFPRDMSGRRLIESTLLMCLLEREQREDAKIRGWNKRPAFAENVIEFPRRAQ